MIALFLCDSNDLILTDEEINQLQIDPYCEGGCNVNHINHQECTMCIDAGWYGMHGPDLPHWWEIESNVTNLS